MLLLASSVAAATGLFENVFQIGNVFAAASRPASISQARDTGLPLPVSDEIGSRWSLNQVYVTRTPTWSSVDLQYGRSGSVGIGITVWSDGPRAPEGSRILTVSGIPVAISRKPGSLWATFDHQGATVVIRGRTLDLDDGEITSIVSDWLVEAR